MIPTISPTRSPTASPSHPLLFPPSISKTTPPSTLYYIEVTVLYDDNPWQTSWKLQGVIGNGFVNGDVKSKAGAPGDTSHTEQIWIPEGLYKFTIMDTWNDGICCMEGNASYKLVTANGTLIAEGGEFETSKSHVFAIPFAP